MSRFLSFDYSLMMLNIYSAGAMWAWLGEHITSLGGLAVMLSVVLLNVTKAVAVIRKIKNNE